MIDHHLRALGLAGATLVNLGLTPGVSPLAFAQSINFTDANWSDSFGLGADGPILAQVVDKNGNVYVAGSFNSIGGVFASSIARWDGNTWYALGSGVNYTVFSLAVDTNGNVYAGGNFTIAGSVSANYVARWNGSSWSPLGTGMSGSDPTGSTYVFSLAFDATGSLYAGGNFTNAGGASAKYVAKWDGGHWSALGPGTSDSVYCLASDNSGSLYAGGVFTSAGGLPARYIATWNGSSWSALGSGMDNAVYSLAADGFGSLYAGGSFGTAGGVPASSIAQWNGSAWSALGLGISAGQPSQVDCIALDNAGSLYAGGAFATAGGIIASNIARWDGSAWSSLGSGMDDQVMSLAFDSSGNLHAGGYFSNGGFWATWNSSAWSALGEGISGGYVNCLAFDSSGDLYTGGYFVGTGGVVAPCVATWNGSAWSALGTGMSGGGGGFGPSVAAFTFDPYGNVYAGGGFVTAGGVAAYNIAKWDGAAWSALGSGMAGFGDFVSCLAIDSSGDLYAGGSFTSPGGMAANNIAKWDGATWSALGSGLDGPVYALAFDPAGNLYAGGAFCTAGGVAATNIAKWDGGAWSALGPGIGLGTGAGISGGEVFALAIDSSGNLYAGGYFTNAGGLSVNSIAKWDGSAWSALGSGLSGGQDTYISPVAYALAFDRSGNLYAGGDFAGAGSATANSIAKWNGSSWSALGSGITGPADYGGLFVNSLAVDSSGNLYAGGDFTTAGNKPSPYLAKALLTGPTFNRMSLVRQNPTTSIITFLGRPGSSYALELATSLAPPVNWVPQLTNTASMNDVATSGYVIFTNVNHWPQAFYRTRYMP